MKGSKTMNNRPTLQDIKQAIRSKYGWPGGYPLYLIMDDGEALSIDAAREQWREIVAAHIARDSWGGWLVAAVDINYENPDLYCAHSGARIESAYAEEEP